MKTFLFCFEKEFPYFILVFKTDTHYNIFPPGTGFPIDINYGINSPTNNALLNKY